MNNAEKDGIRKAQKNSEKERGRVDQRLAVACISSKESAATKFSYYQIRDGQKWKKKGGNDLRLKAPKRSGRRPRAILTSSLLETR